MSDSCTIGRRDVRSEEGGEVGGRGREKRWGWEGINGSVWCRLVGECGAPSC